MRVYEYQCRRCFFRIDDKELIIKHCLNVHGDTGKFKKSYKVITKYKKRNKSEVKMEPEVEKEEIVKIEPVSTETVTVKKEGRWKRKYLHDDKKAPNGAKVFTGESGKQYYMKEIGKKESYIME